MINSFWLSLYVKLVTITDDLSELTTTTLTHEEVGSRFTNMLFLFF